MVNFAKKIIDEKTKAKDRANKTRRTAKGDRNPGRMKDPPSPSRKKSTKSSSALKGLGDLFKNNDPYSGYEPGDWGSDTDLGAFADADWVLKKGGRLKNAGKKRVALRGQRSELRGS